MTETRNLDELTQQMDQLSLRYDARFAGKARATRHVSELDEIIAKLGSLLEEGQSLLNGGDNSKIVALLQSARENLALYKNEREAIVETQSKGSQVVDAAMLATWANFVFDEYHRHFSNKARGSRDIGRMEEMITELDGISQDMELLVSEHDLESTKNDQKTVETNLELYEQELQNILAARVAGSQEDRAGLLAEAANSQFSIYRDQFAGKSRQTRRPELIARMIKNLEGILFNMKDLNAKGLRSQTHSKNLKIVQDNLKMYQSEVEEITKARADVPVEDLASFLGGAANDVMASYKEHFAGKDRATRDLEVLTSICDQMYEVALQMRDIQDSLPDLELNNRNLSIVIDNLVLYHTEYRRVEEAKGMA